MKGLKGLKSCSPAGCCWEVGPQGCCAFRGNHDRSPFLSLCPVPWPGSEWLCCALCSSLWCVAFDYRPQGNPITMSQNKSFCLVNWLFSGICYRIGKLTKSQGTSPRRFLSKNFLDLRETLGSEDPVAFQPLSWFLLGWNIQVKTGLAYSQVVAIH